MQNTILKKSDPDYWEKMIKIGSKAINFTEYNETKRLKSPKISPKQLWHYACLYFKEVDEVPFEKEDFVRGGKFAGSIVKIKNIRPYSWSGLDEYLTRLGILGCTKNYRLNKNDRYPEFIPVIEQIEAIMFNQKFTGAAVGAFNPSIIARELQLAEVTKNEVKAEVKNEIDYSKLSKEALEEIAAQSESNTDKSR